MRFIHLADVHLGAVPDRGASWSSQREKEIWDTFRRVIAEIRDDPVDLLFIAGDLFHRQPLKRELKEVNYLFTTIPDTRVFLIAGNHDYLRADSMYMDFPWAENVIFFDKEELEGVHLDDLNVTVYGFSFLHQEIQEELLAGAVPFEGDGLHILLAHGGDDRHVPMNVKALTAAGFDYVALGHIHKPQILIRDQAAYPGALEPVKQSDLGRHGYIEGESGENGRLHIRFVPFASRSYVQLVLYLDENSTQQGLEDQARGEIARLGSQNIYSIILQGLRSPELLLIPERFKALGNVLEVSDLSRMSYDLEALRKEYRGTLIGDYIEYFNRDRLSVVEEKALYYGLQALLETSRS